MRVLHVYRTYYPDQPSGIAEAIRQTCLCTRPLGVRSTIFVLSPRPHGHYDTGEARVVRARSWAAPASCDIGGPSAFRALAESARDADVLHYHFPWPFGDLLHLAVRPAAAAVLTWHSDVVRQKIAARLYRPLMNAMLRRVSLIAATSPNYAKTSGTLSRPDVRDRVRIVPLGVDERSLSAPDETATSAEGVVAGPFILFLGAMRYYKGIEFLLQAAKLSGVNLVLAGGGQELPALRSLAETMGLNKVSFPGHISEEQKVALLRSCRALVLPSHLRSEAYGMALVEAALCGKPMVSCEIGTGTSYVNLDETTGFVVPPQDPQALAHAMRLLIDHEGLALRFGRAARARYEELFSGEAMGRNHLALYEEALSAGKTDGAAETMPA